MSEKRKIPYWMRRKESCPECGWLPKSHEEDRNFNYMLEVKKQFVCPRCGIIISKCDFIEDQYFKWSKEMVEEIEEL